MIIEDTDTMDSKMNGEPVCILFKKKKSKSNILMFQYKASSYALTLRMQLFKEHLGLLDASASDTFDYRRKENRIVMDPLDDEFYFNVWNKIAEKNTLIYRELFRCVPDDTGKLILF